MQLKITPVLAVVNTSWKLSDDLFRTAHLPLYDFPLEIVPFKHRMPPIGVHLSSYIIGQIFEAKCRGMFGKEALLSLWPFASKRGWIKRGYRPMGLAYKVRMPDGTLRFGLLNGAYLLCGQEWYAQYKARFEEQYEDDVNAKHPWCEKKVDLTSKQWPDFLITPFMGEFPVCSQEPSYPSHPTDSDNVDPFRANYDQRAIGDLRSEWIFAKFRRDPEGLAEV